MNEPLIYPRLVDLPGARPRRRMYLGAGYLPPIPDPDATDAQLLSFARALADPWNGAVEQYYDEYLATMPDEVRDASETIQGMVIFLPHFSTVESPVWSGWDAPLELIDKSQELMRK